MNKKNILLKMSQFFTFIEVQFEAYLRKFLNNCYREIHDKNSRGVQ